MATLIMTAKLNDIDPLAWLADVLARIADAGPASRIAAVELETFERAGGRLSHGGHLHVFTIRRAAQILGRDEDLLWDLSDQLDPEHGKLWVYDTDEAETLAFTPDGIEALREIIKEQVDRAG